MVGLVVNRRQAIDVQRGGLQGADKAFAGQVRSVEPQGRDQRLGRDVAFEAGIRKVLAWLVTREFFLVFAGN